MSWNKTHYNAVKEFMAQQLNSVPWCAQVDNPFDWATTFVPLVKLCQDDEDYEGAKGASDAIREFLNKFVAEQIPHDAKLILPEKLEDIKLRYHLSFGK